MPETEPPTVLWLRRDLRLSDHPGWRAALDAGGPVVPVFVLDPETEAWGAAPLWRLGESLASLARALEARGSRLILRRGPASGVLRRLAAETGARRIVWSRLHDPASAARDREVRAALAADGLAIETANAFHLHEPGDIATAQGGPYRVFTPYWRAIRGKAVPEPLPAPGTLSPPATWPASDHLADWRLGRAMQRGTAVVARHAVIGEEAAEGRLGAFIAHRLAAYAESRDRLDLDATSHLSENLTHGEISPRRIWHAVLAARERSPSRDPAAGRGAEAFLRQLAWREFAWHLLHHAPHLESRAWRPEWDRFP